jgi:hypothetical protein
MTKQEAQERMYELAEEVAEVRDKIGELDMVWRRIIDERRALVREHHDLDLGWRK